MRILTILALLTLCACVDSDPASKSGIKPATATIHAQASGLTTEQENIRGRLQEDNKPGSIKHLYVISAYSGDVLLYSTVRGKVTSSGKRLTPLTVSDTSGQYITLGDGVNRTNEVIQDDGTYGSSVEYVYWWDSKGVYHQHYVTGGQIVHVATAPMRVGKVVINVESEQ
jgi:hypothetical protein